MIWGQLGRSDCRNCVERGAIVSVSHGQIWLLVRANSLGGIVGSRDVRQLRDLVPSGLGLGSMWNDVSYANMRLLSIA